MENETEVPGPKFKRGDQIWYRPVLTQKYTEAEAIIIDRYYNEEKKKWRYLILLFTRPYGTTYNLPKAMEKWEEYIILKPKSQEDESNIKRSYHRAVEH